MQPHNWRAGREAGETPGRTEMSGKEDGEWNVVRNPGGGHPLVCGALWRLSLMNEGRQGTGGSTDHPEGVAEMSLPLLWGKRS